MNEWIDKYLQRGGVCNCRRNDVTVTLTYIFTCGFQLQNGKTN